VKILAGILALLVASLLISSTTIAAGHSKKKSPTSAASTSDTITSVHLTSITINVFATHSAKEFKVTPATKITVNGQPSQLNGLATGMEVAVIPEPDGVTAAASTRKRGASH